MVVLLKLLSPFILFTLLLWFQKWRKKVILEKYSDLECFKCGHTEHKKMLPEQAKMKKEVGMATLGTVGSVLVDGNPLRSMVRGLGGILPADRCVNCGELWKSKQAQALEDHIAGGCMGALAIFWIFVGIMFF